MSSDRAQRTLLRLLFCLLLLAPLACGRKGDPKPPPRKDPARTTDLTITQRGNELILSMSYPAMTSGGLALAGIDKLELWQYTRLAPELMEMPEVPDLGLAEGEMAEGEAEEGEGPAEEATEDEAVTAEAETADASDAEPSEAAEPESEEADSEEAGTGTDPATLAPTEPTNPFLRIMIDPKEFDKQSERILELVGAELDAAVVGGKIFVRVPLTEITTEPPTAHAFAVRSSAGRLRSEQSVPRPFAPIPPPAPVEGLALEPSAQNISLSWTPLGDETEIEGYHVYRRLAQSPSFDQPLAKVNTGVAEYVDSTARFGTRYAYAVATVATLRPLVESTLSPEQTVNYSDTFPPPAPTGLVALAEVGRVRLLWDAGRGRDTAGYLVFASRGDGEPVQLTDEPISASEFVHEDASSGVTYVYTVIAVDSAGNQSESSAETTTRVP
jgi:hypothetical protein